MIHKPILDPCCGGRMFWVDKTNQLVLFADKRDETHVLCDGRTLEISPDLVMDFTKMPFQDKTFKLVIFDPPHMTSLGANSWMAKKYGRLTGNWQDDIRRGFSECWRVLDDYGTMIFKWNEHDVSQKEILGLIEQTPIVTQKTGKNNKTIWMIFFKAPNEAK